MRSSKFKPGQYNVAMRWAGMLWYWDGEAWSTNASDAASYMIHTLPSIIRWATPAGNFEMYQCFSSDSRIAYFHVVVASRRGEKYHLPSCIHGGGDASDTLDGKTQCGHCKPGILPLLATIEPAKKSDSAIRAALCT